MTVNGFKTERLLMENLQGSFDWELKRCVKIGMMLCKVELDPREEILRR